MKLKINRQQENTFYILLLITISISFIIFFSSKLWMYDDNPIRQTPFYTDITGLNQTTIVLNKWEYNPDNELMEVSLKTEHTGFDQVKPTFSFAAKERETLENYSVQVVYNDKENIVVQIKDVPKTYRVIGLFVREHRDKKVVENEIKTAMLESSGSLDQEKVEMTSYEWPKPAEIIIVGDYRKIKINHQLKTKQKADYEQENIQREIKQVETKISMLEDEQIPLQMDLIRSIEKEIKSLEAEMKYKTEDEKQEVTAQITSKQEAIKNAKKEQEGYQKEVENLKEKREKLLKKLNDIRQKSSK